MRKEIDFKKVIHLIFVPLDKPAFSSSNSDNLRMPEVIHKVSDLNYLNIALATTPKQLADRIDSLKEDDLVLLWIHVRKHEKDSMGTPLNLDLGKRLKGSRYKKEKILGESAKVYYFTSGQVFDINGAFLQGKTQGKILNGEEVYSYQVFHEENLDQMPEPVPASTLLPNDWTTAQYLRPLCSENDWRLRNLKNVIGEEKLRSIVGATMPPKYTHFKYDVLVPGFSNSFVLKVVCEENRELDETTYLLKISKNKANIEAEKRMSEPRFRKLPITHFLISTETDHVKNVHGWYCLRTEFGKDKVTLRKYLTSNLEMTNLTEVLEEAMDKFSNFDRALNSHSNGATAIYHKYLNPLKGGDTPQGIHFKGLLPSMPHQTAVFQTFDLFSKRYSRLLEELGINSESNLVFDLFLDNLGIIHSIEKDSLYELVPTKYVHGDFHTANILVNETNGKEAVFIDFANVSEEPNGHAFLDIGKLSTDLDISVVPENMLTSTPGILKEWVDCHHQWLNGHEVTSSTKVFQEIRQLNDWLLNHLIEQHRAFMLENEIRRQFQMVRLHFYLKAIGYNYEMPEKIMFLMRASMDIIEYLK